MVLVWFLVWAASFTLQLPSVASFLPRSLVIQLPSLLTVIFFPFSGPEVGPDTLQLVFNWKPEAVSWNTLVLFQDFYTTYLKTHLLQVNILYPP